MLQPATASVEVTEQSETGVLVNLTAIYQEDDLVSLLYYVDLDEADHEVFEQLVALASFDG